MMEDNDDDDSSTDSLDHKPEDPSTRSSSIDRTIRGDAWNLRRVVRLMFVGRPGSFWIHLI